jgi:hypothetical protein
MGHKMCVINFSAASVHNIFFFQIHNVTLSMYTEIRVGHHMKCVTDFFPQF